MKSLYDRREWLLLRLRILARDSFICTNCGQGPHDGIRVHVHHVKELRLRPDLALNPANLITLCADCHQLHHGRQFTPNPEQLVLL